MTIVRCDGQWTPVQIVEGEGAGKEGLG